MKSRLFIALAFAATSSTVEVHQTIRDEVRRQGPIVLVTLGDDDLHPALTLRDLLRSADLVVRGVVQNPTTRLSDDETRVLTDFEIASPQFIFPRRVSGTAQPGLPAEPVSVTQQGGTMSVEGHRVVSSHPLKPISSGTEAIFMLAREDGRYKIVRNYPGVFAVQNGSVVPLTKSRLGEQHRGKPIATLVDEIVAILKDLGRTN